ncbi:MAG: polyketide synthase [Vulcanimicrobiota bacterium]
MKFTEPVAIVGIGGVFPGADNLDEFWKIIESGKSVSGEVPDERWVISRDTIYSKNNDQVDRAYSTRGCFIRDFDLRNYHPEDFIIDLELVEKLDPLFQITLAAGIQAYKDADLENLDKSRVGVIMGNIALPTEKASRLSYEILGKTLEEELFSTDETPDFETVSYLNRYVNGLPAGLLAKALGLGGGTFTTDSACASSLYALKYACDELLMGRADAMFTGGVARPDCLYTQTGFSQLGALSPTGVSSPFDEKGNGLVIGEGAGVVVLKRLSDALRHNDRIYALIKGIGLSNDRAGNLLAPDQEGQLRAMKSAYEQTGWKPAYLDLVECHGTGTPVGDAVEFNSMKKMWQQDEWQPNQCVIGSVKSNIGHLLTGAGAAGLIKVLLAMKHRKLPPTANYEKPTSKIDVENSPFEILKQSREWKNREPGIPRRAAVSAFGFGGINAHVLLEEPNEGIKVEKNKNNKKLPPVAVVGMDACFGNWADMEKVAKALLKPDENKSPGPKTNWFGVDKSRWFNKWRHTALPFWGYGIEELKAELGQFRIPPVELQEMLPQQLIMLLTANRALEKTGLKKKDHLKTAAFIGIGFDFNTTNFHVRWKIRDRARKWVEQLCPDASNEDKLKWAEQIQDALSPPLNANRTMGALGSIVASRIAREFKFGSPSIAISSEETSGLRALDLAVRGLQTGEIDLALAGAVDMAGDIRALICASHHRCYTSTGNVKPLDGKSNGVLFGEGAGVLVLKRLEDAEKDGDNIFAVVKGIGFSTARDFSNPLPDDDSYMLSMKRALDEASVGPDRVSLFELNSAGCSREDKIEAKVINKVFSGQRETPMILSSSKADLGHTGAASGLLSVIKTCVSLNQKVVPGFPSVENPLDDGLTDKTNYFIPSKTQKLVANKSHIPRCAMVGSFGIDGNCSHVILEEYTESEDDK